MLNDFFSMDGPFFKYGSLVFDLLVLNLIFAVISGPLLLIVLLTYGSSLFVAIPGGAIVFYVLMFLAICHIGPAMTALFYVTNRKVREDDGYLFKDYFTSYKMNYKQSLLISVILCTVFFILNINIAALSGFNIIGTALYLFNLGPAPAAASEVAYSFGGMGKILFPIQMFILLEFIFASSYIYPMLARFHMSTKELFKSAFILSNKHLFTTLANLAIVVGLIALIFMVHGMFVLVVVSGYALLTSYLFERVFKRYIPNEDTEVEEEIEALHDDVEMNEQESLAEIFRKKREEQEQNK